MGYFIAELVICNVLFNIVECRRLGIGAELYIYKGFINSEMRIHIGKYVNH